MTRNPATPDEIIDMLRKSALPTVLVEGKYDLTIYQKLQQRIGTLEVNFLPCGSRSALLKIYERRHEFPNKKALYIAKNNSRICVCV